MAGFELGDLGTSKKKTRRDGRVFWNSMDLVVAFSAALHKCSGFISFRGALFTCIFFTGYFFVPPKTYSHILLLHHAIGDDHWALGIGRV